MSDGYPLAYLITFACYGARLHGDEVGSVDLQHNRFGTPLPAPSNDRFAARSVQMDQPPYVLDAGRRTVVLAAMVGVSDHRGWTLLAAHVRQNHVHAVVRAEELPEKVMNDWKSYASRALNRAGFDAPERHRWTRHGSTRYLWTETVVAEKIHYTLHEQGEPMAIYPEPRP